MQQSSYRLSKRGKRTGRFFVSASRMRLFQREYQEGTQVIRIFRVISILVVAVMMSSLFAGCKNSQPSPAGGNAGQSAKPELAQGLKYYNAGDYDKAIAEFTAAIEKYPNNDAAYYDRAAVYMEQKKFTEAKNDLTRAVEINPHSPGAYYNLAALYSLQNQPDQALHYLDQALQVGFNDYSLLLNDPDLSNVRKQPGFKRMLKKNKISIVK